MLRKGWIKWAGAFGEIVGELPEGIIDKYCLFGTLQAF
jgi:hypothetical protein